MEEVSVSSSSYLDTADVELFICLAAGFGYPIEMIDLFESLVGSLGPFHVQALNSSLFHLDSVYLLRCACMLQFYN